MPSNSYTTLANEKKLTSESICSIEEELSTNDGTGNM